MSFEAEALTGRGSLATESPEVVMYRCYLHDRLTRLRRMLVIPAQAPVAAQPGERPLYHPAALQGDEAPLPRRTTHDHHPVRPAMHAQPAVQLGAVVLGVRLHHLQARPVLARELREQLPSGLRVIDVGRRDDDRQQQAQRVHDDVALAATDLLAAIGAHLLAALRGLDRLAVDAGDAGRRLPPSLGAELGAQGIEDLLPGAIPTPPAEVVVDGPPGWEVVGQGAPGAALAGVVEQGVDDLAHVGLAGAAAGPGGGNQGLQDGPLLIGQVTGIGFALHTLFYVHHPLMEQTLRSPC